ncbi:MAG: hypothetical protein E7436_04660 [Ruminococcaceae bacterium]|nr:hypothetical protein [Oscillospiraceae bacterium]
MKKIALILAVALMLSMVLCACGEDPQPADTTPQTNAPTDPQVPTNAPTVPDGKVTYTVTVLDRDGNPVPGVKLQFCDDESCRLPVTTGEDGKVSVRYDESNYHITLTSVPEGYTAEQTEFYFDGTTELTVTLTAAAQ